MKDKYLIIDFDSTFIQVEALDELAKIVLSTHPYKEELVKKIELITQLGMEGKLKFTESLKIRLNLFKPTEKEIDELIIFLKGKISKSILKNKDFFVRNSKRIYIVSGGFYEYIYPVVKNYSITMDHILANEFLFDRNGKFQGYDTNNPLSKTGGKVKAVKQLRLPSEVIVLGDGYTDWEIKHAGLADKFYAFIENVNRKKVTQVADQVITSFDEIIEIL